MTSGSKAPGKTTGRRRRPDRPIVRYGEYDDLDLGARIKVMIAAARDVGAIALCYADDRADRPLQEFAAIMAVAAVQIEKQAQDILAQVKRPRVQTHNQ